MNKIVFFILLNLFILCSVKQTEALPIKKLASDLLSFVGKGTYYDVGPGSCGQTNSNSEMVVAVNKEQMANGGNPNSNPKCNKKVKIVGPSGKSATARVVDTCPGCDSGSLDMSPALFKKVCGDLGLGVCSIHWGFE
ncbi:hypothetical protein G6F70_004660 [Rhizopus microsporus]|uniref:RlpA-like protein double-psi beta-barrel domain-containing protein n=2 Tax=Rhizopus TaxID=4842 RepID=A0A367K485_RHIAZ|nr:hypothetical protein G6F71_004719 [Rhizopus microsporus]RCH96970.1 hypothetical protein CU097_011118 [Rhizopus azygosporus]KAG1199727.1 hypothetical protein G6F70_004660 [Rhizopus microsporus]KAG1211461.1 hypothetical protein G6F69_004569 [Rhizopus microsporus]KAG1233386.1 hypothetical protein G6F67_004307 [Rhizopus microsporus]